MDTVIKITFYWIHDETTIHVNIDRSTIIHLIVPPIIGEKNNNVNIHQDHNIIDSKYLVGIIFWIILIFT